MKLTTPPEYVLRGLRMALGVTICLALGYMAINYQFVGEERLLFAHNTRSGTPAVRASLHALACPAMDPVQTLSTDMSSFASRER